MVRSDIIKQESLECGSWMWGKRIKEARLIQRFYFKEHRKPAWWLMLKIPTT
jgi:hypothetical protein